VTAPSPAAQWLEARYTRAVALRVIYHQLTRQLQSGAGTPADYHRLKRRRFRVLDHLTRLTGDMP
jgi:hypothetical protein